MQSWWLCIIFKTATVQTECIRRAMHIISNAACLLSCIHNNQIVNIGLLVAALLGSN